MITASTQHYATCERSCILNTL